MAAVGIKGLSSKFVQSRL